MTRDELMEIFREAAGEKIEVPLAPKWEGGVIQLVPGKADVQAKELPIDALFHKVVMVRDRLRTLEQKINAHAKLTDAEKVDMQQYITRVLRLADQLQRALPRQGRPVRRAKGRGLAMALTEDFAAAQDRVKTLKSRPSNETLLDLYALFKQATAGDVQGKRPGMLDLKGRAKFDAWSGKKGVVEGRGDGAVRGAGEPAARRGLEGDSAADQRRDQGDVAAALGRLDPVAPFGLEEEVAAQVQVQAEGSHQADVEPGADLLAELRQLGGVPGDSDRAVRPQAGTRERGRASTPPRPRAGRTRRTAGRCAGTSGGTSGTRAPRCGRRPPARSPSPDVTGREDDHPTGAHLSANRGSRGSASAGARAAAAPRPPGNHLRDHHDRRGSTSGTTTTGGGIISGTTTTGGTITCDHHRRPCGHGSAARPEPGTAGPRGGVREGRVCVRRATPAPARVQEPRRKPRREPALHRVYLRSGCVPDPVRCRRPAK